MLKELREKRSAAAKAMAALKTLIETEKRAFTDEERTQFDQHQTDHETHDAEIKKLEGDEKRMSAVASVVAAEERRKVNNFKPTVTPEQDVDLTDKEKRNFDMDSLVQDLASGNMSNSFEREVCDEYRRKNPMLSNQRGMIHIPPVITNQMAAEERNLVVGTDSAGGYLVQDELHNDKFIESLVENSVLLKNVNRLEGLVGNLDLPMEISGLTVDQYTEAADTVDSQPVFGDVSFRPNRLSASVPYSNQLVMQSGQFVSKYLMGTMKRDHELEAEKYIIDMIMAASGVGGVELGANGGTLSWADVVNLRSQVTSENAAKGKTAYIMNSLVEGQLQLTPKEAGEATYILGENGRMNGQQTFVTNLMPDNLTKGTSNGNCSAMAYVNLDKVYVGFWGGMSLVVDNITQAGKDITKLTAHRYMDAKLPQPEAVALIRDIITS